MNYKQIEERLTRLKQDRSRRDVLKLQIEGLQDYIEKLANMNEEGKEEWSKLSNDIIEAMTFRIASEERVSSSGTSDKTGRIALSYDKEIQSLQEAIKEAQRRIMELKQDFKPLDNKVRILERALDGLTEKQKYIVESKCCEGLFWREIEIEYNNKYKVFITSDQLKKIKIEAMTKLEEILKG